MTTPLTPALAQFARGGFARSATAAADDPSVFIDAGDQVFWFRADNVTLNGADVSAITDKFAETNSLSQGTAAAQPVWLETGGPNSTEATQGDGTENLVNHQVTSWLAANNDFTIYAVVRFETASFNNCVLEARPMRLYGDDVGGNLRFRWRNESTSHNVLVDGSAYSTWYAVRARYEDDTAAYLRIDNGVEASVALSASSDAIDRTALHANSSGTLDSQSTVAEYFCMKGMPSAGQDTSAAAYLNQRYGLSLTW